MLEPGPLSAEIAIEEKVSTPASPRGTTHSTSDQTERRSTVPAKKAAAMMISPAVTRCQLVRRSRCFTQPPTKEAREKAMNCRVMKKPKLEAPTPKRSALIDNSEYNRCR
ncbi:MAG: hypothetical protein A2V99_07185 [Spirochaetes bacterium RBG_16_67_19]|nr:MAG: hypothetical protein A2V99_07185 [Spirochaetes bacterium RBG_16_67_19]